MERKHTPLSVWFWEAYLVASQTPDISAIQFQRQLGMSRYETAFQILHNLRAGMVRPDQDRIGGKPGEVVEADEAYVGGRTRGKGRGIHGLVEWYNNEHRHSAIRFVTPAQRHEGLDETLLHNRKVVYETARARNPQRWSEPTRNWQRVHAFHLNPDKDDTDHYPITKERIQNKKAA